MTPPPHQGGYTLVGKCSTCTADTTTLFTLRRLAELGREHEAALSTRDRAVAKAQTAADEDAAAHENACAALRAEHNAALSRIRVDAEERAEAEAAQRSEMADEHAATVEELHLYKLELQARAHV